MQNRFVPFLLLILCLLLPLPLAAAPEGLDEDALERLIRERTGMGAAPASPPPPTATPNTTTPAAENSRRTSNTDDAGDLIMNAMSLIGVSYRFGGNSPTQGLDCSGFMQYIFRRSMGITLPRTSAAMATVGQHVERSALKPGDLVFFRTSGNRISHVGMFIGNDRFIHAPRAGKNIEITAMSSNYWNSRYATARRVSRSDRFTQ